MNGIQYCTHRRARLLKQQSSITIYRFPTKEKKLPLLFPFVANRSFSVSVFRLQQTKKSCRFLLVPFTEYLYIFCRFNIYIYIYLYENRTDGKRQLLYVCCIWEMEAQVVFLNPFSICSSCKRKFVVCPFVDEETNGSYPVANGLNGLAHLWLYI